MQTKSSVIVNMGFWVLVGRNVNFVLRLMNFSNWKHYCYLTETSINKSNIIIESKQTLKAISV